MSIVPKDILDISNASGRCKGLVHCAAGCAAYDMGTMCNLYSLTSAQSAITDLVNLWRDDTGNLPNMTGIYPDYPAPVITKTPEGRVMQMMRWGMPSPAFALKGKKTDKGLTNVRNTTSPHWRRWLGPAHRCLVPFTSFAEPLHVKGEKPRNVWFAPIGPQETLFFAGIWTEWTSVRKLKEGETTNNLFAFLTVEPNDVVRPIHPKAMPVILRSSEAITHWLESPVESALKLQRPFPDDGLKIVDGPI